jgi:hypothetical protein
MDNCRWTYPLFFDIPIQGATDFERKFFAIATFCVAIFCFVINGGVATIMISGQLIANHAFAAIYINMVVCECVNSLAFAFWIAPVTYL